MEFTLAYLKSDKQAIIKQFKDDGNLPISTVDINELHEHNIQALIYPQSIQSDELMALLIKEHKYYPIIDSNTISNEDFNIENISKDDAYSIFEDLQEKWLIHNNLKLLEDLIGTVNHLKALWPNDRSDFFEELWFILRNNLGANNLKVIYNDALKSIKKHEKDKLIQVLVEGERTPVPSEGTELEEKIMENYSFKSNKSFELVEYDKEHGSSVFIAEINESPIVIMASIFNLGQLQISLFKALFDGLSSS